MSLVRKITHLSPSALAKFRAQPAIWVMQYLYGIKEDGGPAAKRGSAVEAGVQVALANINATLEECQNAALDSFTVLTEGEITDQIDKEKDNIRGMVRQAIPMLQPLGRPDSYQLKIEHWFDDVPVPVIGYTDWTWQGIIVDLKTTMRMPSGIRPDHKAQVALYSAAKKRPAAILYTTDTKSKLVRLTEAEVKEGLSDLERSAKSLLHALNNFHTPKDMLKAFPVDFESYLWSDSMKSKYMEMVKHV